MEVIEFQELIKQPESDILEYKTSIPDANRVARLIASFANTKGGNLVIGVREGKDGNQIVGTDVGRTEAILAQVQQKISPQLEFQTDIVSIDDKPVIIVTVPKSQTPRLVDGDAFQRKGDMLSKITVLEPDVNFSAYNAVVSGSGAVAQGNGSVAVGDNGIIVGGDIHNIVITQQDFVSYDVAFERVIGSTTFVLTQLELSYRQTREQAQGWYRSSLIAAFLGFLLVVVGVITVIFGQTTAGLITTISGIVPEVVAGLFFVQSRQANQRVDAIQEKLTSAREILTAVEIVNTIKDPQERDKLKGKIVRKALQIK